MHAMSTVLYPLLDQLRAYKVESTKIGAWLEEREAEFEACGTIGANLDRCIEQAVILEVRVIWTPEMRPPL